MHPRPPFYSKNLAWFNVSLQDRREHRQVGPTDDGDAPKLCHNFSSFSLTCELTHSPSGPLICSLAFDQVGLVSATFQFHFRLSFRCPHSSFTIPIMYTRSIFNSYNFSLRVQDDPQDIPFLCLYFNFSILIILFIFIYPFYIWRGPLQTPQQRERAVLSLRIKKDGSSY